MLRRMHEPPWLDADEMRAWRSFIETVGDLIAALDADLQEAGALGLGDYQVLVYLSEAEGWSLRMCDLAPRCWKSPRTPCPMRCRKASTGSI